VVKGEWYRLALHSIRGLFLIDVALICENRVLKIVLTGDLIASGSKRAKAHVVHSTVFFQPPARIDALQS
jgi:hypothetical protein